MVVWLQRVGTKNSGQGCGIGVPTKQESRSFPRTGQIGMLSVGEFTEVVGISIRTVIFLRIGRVLRFPGTG